VWSPKATTNELWQLENQGVTASSLPFGNDWSSYFTAWKDGDWSYNDIAGALVEKFIRRDGHVISFVSLSLIGDYSIRSKNDLVCGGTGSKTKRQPAERPCGNTGIASGFWILPSAATPQTNSSVILESGVQYYVVFRYTTK
jgi:hypothetical protein